MSQVRSLFRLPGKCWVKGTGQIEYENKNFRRDQPLDIVLSVTSFCHTLSFEGPSFSWLGRQIVNLEVAGSNPVGPAIFFCVC